jgi:hypothetical protein
MIFYPSAQNRYEVRKVSDSSYAVNPFSQRDFVVNFNTDAQFRGIVIERSDFGSPGGLEFNWEGVPSAGGTIVLSLKDNSRTVSITANTGKVSLQ